MKIFNFCDSYPPDRDPVWAALVAARQTLGENIFAITHYTPHRAVLWAPLQPYPPIQLLSTRENETEKHKD